MPIQSSFYPTDGETKTYPSTKHIATKQHMAVWLRQVSDSTYVQLDSASFQLINNTAVLDDAPDVSTYNQIEIRVADNSDELTTSPNDITVVAGLSAEIATVASIESEITDVASEPLKTEILNAETNATNAATSAGEAASSASQASTSATNASTSAGLALASETSAETYKDEALISRNEAESFRNEAEQFANEAEASANRAEAFDPENYKLPLTLTGNTSVNENSDLVLTITDYDADATYVFETPAGTVNRVDDIVTVSVGTVSVDTAYQLRGEVTKAGYLPNIVYYDFTVLNVPIQNDTDAYIDVAGTDFNSTNFPTIEGAYLDDALVAVVKGGDGASNASTTDAVPTMTSNTSPSGVASASSIFGAAYEPYKAFDGTTTDEWVTVGGTITGWIKYQFAQAKIINKYTLQSADVGQAGTDAPMDWTLEGSNNDSDWDVLDTVAGESYTAALETHTFTFTNSTPYLYYRLNITDNNGYVTYTAISELELIEAQDLAHATATSAFEAKVDAQGDWSGVQADAYVTSELPNVLSSADATDAVVDGEVVDGDKVYVGDSSNFATVTASGADATLDTDITLTSKYVFSGDATDSVGTNDATANTASLIDGKAVYSGSQNTQLPNNIITTDGNGWTYRVKVSFTSTAFEDIIDNAGSSSTYNGDALVITNGNFRYIMQNASGSNLVSLISPDTYNDGQEYQVSVSIPNTIGEAVNLFVDGELVASTAMTGTISSRSQSIVVFGGYKQSSVISRLNATLDDVEFIDYAITHEEELALIKGAVTKLPHNQAFTPTFVCKEDNVDFEVTVNGGTDYTELTKDDATFEGTAPTKSFAVDTYTGNGTSQDRVTGIGSGDLTQGVVDSLSRTILHDRAGLGDCYVKVDGIQTDSGSAVLNLSHLYIKSRSVAGNGYTYDGLRGVNNYIKTDNTNAEESTGLYMPSFNNDGYTVSNSGHNTDTQTYVAYQTLYTHLKWGLTNHSKRYIESYNPLTGDGMIIVQGSGLSNHQVPHSIGRTLDFTVVKSLSGAYNWNIQLSTFTDPNDVLLYITAAQQDSSGFSGGASFGALPNASNIVLNGTVQTNNGSELYIIYYKAKSKTWTLVEYEGTGTESINFIETRDVNGIPRRPSRVMIKRTDSTGDWYVYDNQRPNSEQIKLNTSEIAAGYSCVINIQDTGFEWPASACLSNLSGGQYIALVEFDTYENGGGSYMDELLVKELFASEDLTTVAGQSLGFKVKQKEEGTKTTAIFAGLTETGA